MEKFAPKTLLAFAFLFLVGTGAYASSHGPQFYNPLDFPCTHDRSQSVSPNINIIDSTRANKAVTVRVHYPTSCTGNPIVPIVIYSHGGGYDDNGDFGGRGEWADTLAMAGYFVIRISHQPPANKAMLCDKFGLVPSTQANEEDICISSATTNGRLVMSSFEIPADALAVVKELQSSPSLLDTYIADSAGTVDINRLGVIGFSSGSRMSLTLAGAKRMLNRTDIYDMMEDPDLLPPASGTTSIYGQGLLPLNVDRTVAAAMSPQSAGYYKYYCGASFARNDRCTSTTHSFDEMDWTFIVGTGSQDRWHGTHDGISVENRIQPYELVPTSASSPNQYLYFLGNDGGVNNDGAIHNFFNLRTALTTPMPNPTDALRMAVVATFDSVLKRSPRRAKADWLLNRSSRIKDLASDHPDNNQPPRYQTDFLNK